MNEDRIKWVKEIALAILISYVYMSFTLGISPLFLVLLPVPFIIIGRRNNLYVSMAGMTIMTIILGLISGGSFATSIFIIFMPFTITIGYMLENNKSIGKNILAGMVVFLVSLIIILVIENIVTGIGPAEQIEQGFIDMLEVQKDMLVDLELTDSEINKTLGLLRSVYDYTIVVMPSIFLVSSFVFSYLNYKLSTFILNNMGYREIKVPSLSLFKLPNSTILGAVTIVVATVIINKLKLEYYNALNANMAVILGTTFLFQGIAILSFFLKKMGLGKVFRLILITMNLIFVPLGSILILVGFADSIFDFRKIREKTL